MELVPTKSYWYSINFVFNNNSSVRYKSIRELLVKLFLNESKGIYEIERKKLTRVNKV